MITGAAKGIGAGCAEVFAEAGARLALWDRDLPAATALAERLNQLPAATAIAVHCDVADSAQIQHALIKTLDKFGQLDCLINNAGIHPPDTPLQRTTVNEAQQVMRVNFFSTYAACLHAIEPLKQTRGSIINVSSMTAVLGQKNSCAYAASKGAQLSFTKSLALELAPFGVRVNAVLPSNVDTPLMRQWAATLDNPEAALERIAALQPLGRMAVPQEIGRVCLFLATEDASFITGQGIQADGGASLDY